MPGVENSVCILMMAGQFFPKPGSIFESSLHYSLHGGVFNKHMRSFKDQPAYFVVVSARIDQGNGAAIAVAQQNGFVNAKFLEEFRQNRLAFMVDIADGSFFFERLRIAVTVA